MKNLISILMISLLFASCNQSNEAGTKKASDVTEISLTQLVSTPESVEGTIKVKGMVTHVCKHGGQKMFLTNDAKDADMLIRVSKSIPEFDVALEGSMVEITGKLISTLKAPENVAGHDGEEEANCAAEEKIDDQTQNDMMTYHIEATSFKELTAEI